MKPVIKEDKVAIVYGSQTGTALDAAWFLHSRLRNLASCSLVDGNTLIQRGYILEIAIFIVATAGNGDFPVNFRALWDNLKQNRVDWQKIRFAVFGLGDSKYPQYNYAARRLYGQLRNMGATPLLQLGCGDDQHTLGYLQEFVPWVDLLCHSIFGAKLDEIATESPTRPVQCCPASDELVYIPNLNFGRISRNSRMTSPSHFQDVRSIKVQLLCKWEYKAGDVVAVRPTINEDLVRAFISEILKDEPLRMISIKNHGICHLATSGRYSILQLLCETIDITSLPSQVFFERLNNLFVSRLSEHPTEEQLVVKDKLYTLAAFSPEGASERLRYAVKERLSIREILVDFHHFVSFKIEDLIDVIPVISPRYYSVCNACDSKRRSLSPVTSAKFPVTEVEICVALVDYTTLFGRRRTGLTSDYLKNLHVGQIVSSMWLERGFNTALVDGLSTADSVLLVGPGTGIAPLRAIVEKFNHEQMLLLTGFRHSERDFLFQGDIETRFGGKCETLVAWSRPDSTGTEFSWSFFSKDTVSGTGCEKGRKTWVQDLITCSPDLVKNIISNDRIIIVIAGRSHPMPYQVVEALTTLVGPERIRQLERSNRIVYDTWG
jgi:sulfite reductase alpha subunit-like flavoprotein